jgi:hypothetical protein
VFLWVASKAISAPAGTATTTVSWTSGFTVYASTGNGQNGVKSAEAIVYQWATTIPTISGTSTYTWATDSVSSAPAGWFTTISDTGSAGQTLWAASVSLTDSVTATTTTVNWATASILPFGYSGSTGAVARVAYTAASTTLSTTPTTSTVTGDALPATGTWGAGQVWTYTVPTLSAGQSVWQSDGIYNPTNNQTIWSVPYLSSLKVGNLSAISTNTGSLTVSGNITVGAYGAVRGGQTAYNTGTGFFLGYSGTTYKFSIGSATQSLTWDGSVLNINGNIISSGKAQFDGNNGDLLGTAVKANLGGAADIGVQGYAGPSSIGIGIAGQASASSTVGVSGAVSTTAARTGVLARSTVAGGTALEVNGGVMIIDNSTLVTNLNADYVDGKHASAFVQVASGTTNGAYVYYVNNNTAPTDPVNRAAWIRVSTNDGNFVYFPGYL